MIKRSGVVAAVGLALAVAGCQGHQAAGGPSAAPSPVVSPSPTAGPSSDALVAYRGMWAAFVKAADTADPDNADLRLYTSDQALTLIVGSLVTDRDQGKVVHGNVVLSPVVTAPSPAGAPTQVTVLDCIDMRNWLEYKASGGLWDNKPGGWHHLAATITEGGGTWKVSTFMLQPKGSCGPSAGASSVA